VDRKGKFNVKTAEGKGRFAFAVGKDVVSAGAQILV
jgi:hypothetical protein